MILEKIVLQNFRNHPKKTFEFSAGKNLIVGVNAVGKTNILEAIYLLSSGKSFRVRGVESEMIKYGEETGRVIGEIGENKGEKGTNLEILLTTGEVMGEKVGKKKYLVNGVAKRAADFIGLLKSVYFGPEDLELIIGSPGTRRKYLDSALSQIDREYARASLSYEKGLRSRNRILEEMRECGLTDRRRLYFWDQLLIKNGNVLTTKREEYLNYINNLQFEIFNFKPALPTKSSSAYFQSKSSSAYFQSKSSSAYFQFNLVYDRSSISVERLAQYADQEVAAGTTLVGPHRDDFSFQIKSSEKESRNLAVYGSRGEERLAVLWIKLGELEFMKEKTKETPLLLLDDIFSELDPEHRKLVLDVVEKQQAIITSADIGMVEKEWLSDVKIIEL